MNRFLKLFAWLATVAAYGLGLWQAPFSVITFVLGIPVCNWLVNLFHELGHLLAYLLLKLEWKRMVVSFLIWERGKGVRIDLRQRLYAASCTCTHRVTVPLWRYRVALFAGSALTLALSAGAIVAFRFTKEWSAAFCLCFGIVCGLNALVNLLPFSPDRVLLKLIKKERENSE